VTTFDADRCLCQRHQTKCRTTGLKRNTNFSFLSPQIITSILTQDTLILHVIILVMLSDILSVFH